MQKHMCERCGYDEATRESPIELSDHYKDVCDYCYKQLLKLSIKFGDYDTDL